jgi:hypothetical protein
LLRASDFRERFWDRLRESIHRDSCSRIPTFRHVRKADSLPVTLKHVLSFNVLTFQLCRDARMQEFPCPRPTPRLRAAAQQRWRATSLYRIPVHTPSEWQARRGSAPQTPPAHAPTRGRLPKGCNLSSVLVELRRARHLAPAPSRLSVRRRRQGIPRWSAAAARAHHAHCSQPCSGWLLGRVFCCWAVSFRRSTLL